MIDGEPVSEIRFTETTLVPAQYTASSAHALAKLVNRVLWLEVDSADRGPALAAREAFGPTDAPAWSLVFYRGGREVKAAHNLDVHALIRAVGERNAAAIRQSEAGAGNRLNGEDLVFYEGASPARRAFMLKVGGAVARYAGLDIDEAWSPLTALRARFKALETPSWPFAYQGSSHDEVLIAIARDALGPMQSQQIAIVAVDDARRSADLQAAIDRSLAMYADIYHTVGPDCTADTLDAGTSPLARYDEITCATVPGFGAWNQIYWKLASQRSLREDGLLNLYSPDEHVAALRAMTALEREYNVQGGLADMRQITIQCGLAGERDMHEEEARLLDEANEAGMDCPVPTL